MTARARAASAARLAGPPEGLKPPDIQRAIHDARAAVRAIDFTKPNLVLWLPGTSNHVLSPAFMQAMKGVLSLGTVALSVVDHMSTWDLPASVPTGKLTLRLVLDAIAARGGNHRVMLAGESQGAWIATDVMGELAYAGQVVAATVFGHPSIALRHGLPNGEDPRILEVNNPGDPISFPIKGDRVDAIRTISAIYLGKVVPNLPLILKVLLQNPRTGAMVVMRALRSKGIIPKAANDAHRYTDEMRRGVDFLAGHIGARRGGRPPAARGVLRRELAE